MKQISSNQATAIVELIKKAGDALLQFFPGEALGKELSVQTKSDGSFVTAADFAANKIICEGIKEIFPEDLIFSEELSPPEVLDASRRVWIIDPLDGTKNFIEGKKEFSILIAACEQNRPVYSLMHAPALSLLLQASKDGPSFLNQQRLMVSESQEFRPASIYARKVEFPPLQIFRNQWMDSNSALIELASGILDGVVLRMGNLKEWDVAAPSLIIERAGGLVTDEQGKQLEFYYGEPRFAYFVAANPNLHAKLLKMMQKI